MDVNLNYIKDYRIFYLTDPFRIVIDIFPVKNPDGTSSSDIPEQPEPTKSGYTMVRQLGLGIRRVVIDPGHGGTDPGCVGVTGLREKDVVLKVSKKLRKLLKSNSDLEVVLTRETDIFMPVENRTVIANQKQGDIFISVHANAHRNKRLKGIETFFLNISHDPSVNEIAAKENATSQKSISKMRGIISKIVKNSKIIESRELAEKIQESLVGSLSHKFKNIKSLGVKGGPFWVLIGCEIPSVLVEISYLSNPGEEKNLKNDLYLQSIAEGIYRGIIDYIHSLGKG
jgi:N-acetylmuramoyl-L-alanine amidase